MESYIKFELDDDNTVFIQTKNTQENDSFLVEAGQGQKVITKTKESLDKLLSQIGTVATGIVDSVEKIVSPPDELEVEFGISVSSDANIIITSVNADANISVKMMWKKG